MSKFIVVGDATVDQMYFVPNLPVAGNEVTASRASLQPGGAGGTVATVLARLGHDVKITTRVGTGPFASLALQYIEAAGVDMSLVQKDNKLPTSSVTLLITPDTQRTMISSLGASRNLDAAELNAADVEQCDALVMSAYSLIGGPQREYAVKALELAKQSRLTTFIDMGSGAVNALHDRIIQIIEDIDYMLMNEQELYALTNEESISDAITWLAERGFHNVVVKVGANGSIVITPDFTELVDPLELDDIIDSTGAGDYFTAVFAHAIMQGHEIRTAATMANIAGALNATHVGAQSYDISVEDIEQYLAEF